MMHQCQQPAAVAEQIGHLHHHHHTHCRHTLHHHAHHQHLSSHKHLAQPPTPPKQRRASSGIDLAQGGDHPENLMWRFDYELAGDPDVIISPPPPPPPPASAMSSGSSSSVARTPTL